MRVFISWSGERSRQLAVTLQDWLRRVIQRVRPWLSIDDLEKGTRWGQELTDQLEHSDFGIICITRENAREPWILFEAGSLSKKGTARVIPYLLGIEHRELPAPLSQFNVSMTTRDDTKRMIRSVNSALATDALDSRDLDSSFEKWWPELEEAIRAIPPSPEPPPPAPSPTEVVRDVAAKLESMLKVTQMRDEEMRHRSQDEIHRSRSVMEESLKRVELRLDELSDQIAATEERLKRSPGLL